MLIDADSPATPFRPPPVEELTEAERRSLRGKLVGAVDSWRGAVEIGLRVDRLHRRAEPGQAPDEDVWLCMGAVPLAVGLTAVAAASLLSVSLGADPPDLDQSRLTDLDLALLDVWAGRAVPELARSLGAAAAGGVVRRQRCPDDLTEGPAMVADLTFASGRSAGAIVIGEELTRARDATTASPTLADHPDALLHAAVAADAVIAAEPVPVRDLLELEVGDVLLLGNRDTLGAQVIAGGSPVAPGRPGARRGRRAIRVTGGVESIDADTLGDTADAI